MLCAKRFVANNAGCWSVRKTPVPKTGIYGLNDRDHTAGNCNLKRDLIANIECAI